ncbi:pyruvate phosphate dikinase [Planomonospora sphaerica]|uniref:Pyruvate phosphate dikinase n=1 Tax=Planomonospora sphaerica TaxID=161355 RepID=A0A161LR15_9ACTN|nr:PEP/pyruvate-binding domain-containing protein [Planomonospora sphaerica]GAT69976.1 pyruvate phosphate dikinase [Planomonospora sphaerica]
MNTLPFDGPGADLATVGGKGESLARLARAGLPVPPGFHVTTAAYRGFVARHGLRDAILAGGADEIAALFTAHGIPEEIAGDVRDAYRRLCGDRGDVPVAVRSSATAEDLPGMSFAGQQESHLNIRGAEELLDAVRRCWASLWTDRAVAYRERHGIPRDQVALAVVVQELVPADAAGVLFTEDRGRLTVNAAWGLGEAVVGGLVTPDTFTVDRDRRTVVAETVASKTVMTVRTPGGTREEPVPPGLRDRPALSAAQALELAGLGLRIEELYGHPVDVEWALHGGRPYILQARPITGRREEWNDSLRGDYLWTNGNLGEAIPSVMTPCTWSAVRAFMADAMIFSELGGHPLCGNIGGRFYMNLSVTASLAAALGMGGRLRAAQEPVFGRIPEGLTPPPLPMPRRRILREALPIIRGRLALRGYARRLPEFLATAAARAESLRAEIAAAEDLPALWRDRVEPYFRECSRMLAAAGRQDAGALIFLRNRLVRLVGEEDANALTSGIRVGGGRLESLGPLLGLARLGRGEIDRETFARRYGHRCPDEFELSAPRPGEDPEWIGRLLAASATDPAELLERQDEVGRAAWRRFRERAPRRAARLRRKVDRWGAIVQAREEARSETIRSFWVLRDFVLRAGELTGHGDDLFFLTIDEILDVLRGGRRPLSSVAERRAAYEHYRSLPPYPGVIRGRFDPERWAADPDRRGDVFDSHAPPAPAPETVTGFPGAAGVVEGTARVITSMEEGHRLGRGEILVTTVTNVGWTPLFPRAAAVVTDVGAPLSHASIVARELGIPAVVGTGDATMRVRDGDRIRVDGGRGSVEVIAPAEAPGPYGVSA